MNKHRLDQLRQRAKQLLTEGDESPASASADSRLSVLLHELNIYSAELDAQEKELLDSQAEALEKSRFLSIVLEKTPVGLLTINRSSGTVVTVNQLAQSYISRFQFGSSAFNGLNYLLQKSSSDLSLLAWLHDATSQVITVKAKHSPALWFTLTKIELTEDDFLIAIEDTTYQKQLTQLHEKLDAVIQNTTDAMVVTNASGKIELFSKAATTMFGFDANDVIGRNLEILMAPDIAIAHADYMNNYDPELGSKILGRFRKLVARRADGTEFPVAVRIAECKIDNARYFVGEIRDETVRVRTNEELENALQAQSRFIATMNHELRTPLNGIVGLLGLLSDDKISKEERDLYLSSAQDSADVLRGLIDDVLDYAKMQSGGIHLNLVNFDPMELVQKVIAPFLGHDKVLAEAVTLKVDVSDAQQVRLLGDAQKLRQIVTNIVGNAIKFTDHGTVILTIGTKPIGSKIMLSIEVADTGKGIETHQIARLFDPFEQVDEEERNSDGGSGLGLTIAREYVLLMGGEIQAHSEVGVGTTFSLNIPFQKAPSTAGSAEADYQESKPSVAESLDGLRVLVVDDNAVNRLVASRTLEKLGAVTGQASDGNDAIAQLVENSWDVVLLDCIMPQKDGYTALADIRSGSAGASNRDIPIVMFTANATSDDKERCLSLGANAYITKPAPAHVLLEHLQTFVGGAASRSAE